MKASVDVGDAKNKIRGALANKGVRAVEVLGETIGSIRPDDLPVFLRWLKAYPGRRTRLFPPEKVTSYSELWSRKLTRT